MDDTLPDVVRISTLHYITSDQQPERPPHCPLLSVKFYSVGKFFQKQ